MKRKISIPAALLLAALLTGGRYALRKAGYEPGMLTLLLLSPMLEETVYRGALFGSLRREMPGWAAALISAGLFAAGHQGVPGIIAALAFGVLAAWLTEKTGRLRWPVLLHIGWNLGFFLMSGGK